MIKEKAIVISVTEKETWIETQRKTVCGQCSASKGCGTSVLAKVVGKKISTMRAINKINAQVGDEVVVGLNESALVKGAAMTYLMPLLFMFVFALIGQVITDNLHYTNEMITIIFAVAGLSIGLRQLKKFSGLIDNDKNYQPVILKQTDLAAKRLVSFH